jgi:hypothetical protein
MAYSSQLPADSDPRSRGTISPDDALPPVEPPSAGFILQLFVVPGVIVTIIVLVWLLFNWLAQMGNDPDEYVDAIKRNNEGRWQAAVNLANALNNERGPGFKELRRNKKVVNELSQVLNEEIDDGSMAEKPVMFRMFLCRAIGSFEVPDGLPVLLKAVETNRGKEEETVRRSALEAIALLADNVLKAEPKQRLENPKLESTLLAATGDSDPLIRSSAAFAMGVIGGEPLLARLRFMTKDSYPDVRYNAATALARQGDPAARDVLLEMIDPDEVAGVNIEEEKGRDFKRALIEFNALRAIGTLLQVNPQISGEEFVPTLEKLLKRKLPNNVKLEAENVLRTIQKPRSAEKPLTSAA